MLKVSYQEPGTELIQEILGDSPPKPSEDVALLWILESFEQRGEPVSADWAADLETLRRQVAALGVSKVRWEVVGR